MTRLQILIAEFQKISPFTIRFKDESWIMKLLNVFVVWYNPDFMTHYTTILGNSVYLPKRSYTYSEEDRLMRILTHEMVHLLDQKRYSSPLFITGYLFPQIMAIGVLSFPILGYWALCFLIFLLPFPAPFRGYFESRAYAIDVLTAHPEKQVATLRYAAKDLCSWNYYRIHPDEEMMRDSISYWIQTAESGKDPVLTKVLLTYEMVQEMYES